VLADVASATDVRDLIRRTEQEVGRLDILVNNAGGVEPPYFPDTAAGRWRRVVEVNLLGVMLCTAHASSRCALVVQARS
jgi:NAD(P)-dependent dehydrogenase (short-subunit alcohol dehydrogenase family)